MKEIKYRAWALDKDLKMRLIYSDEFKNLEHYFDLTDDFNQMQFTGLHDKNGKEIYEGDIVQGMKSLDDDGLIEVDKFVFGRILQMKESQDKSVEVIGNIYEQSQLVDNK